MDDFEFVFALYSLLLGLSMVELLGGLGRAIEARFAAEAERAKFAIGWLTSLLAIFVMLDLLSFWSAAWFARDDIAVSSTALLGVAAFASVYFLAARLVFPSHPEGFANLDVHYFRVRRIVLGPAAGAAGCAACLLCVAARPGGCPCASGRVDHDRWCSSR